MARAIGTIEGCTTNELGEAVINFCVLVLPEVGDEYPVQDHHLQYITSGSQTATQINNGIQNEAITQMALLGITLTNAKFIQTKFT